jgi:hypothetical protein
LFFAHDHNPAQKGVRENSRFFTDLMEKKGANGLWCGTAFTKLNKNLYSFLSGLALINFCAVDTDEIFVRI